MRYFYAFLSVGLLFSCGEEERATGPDNGTEISDSLNSGIIEYDLNEERLSAVDYNNKLSLIQQNVYDQINVLFLSDAEMVRQNHDNTIFEIELKSTDLEKTEAPEGGEGFKSALKDLISFYKTELNTGFLEILPLLETEQESRTDAEAYRLIDYDEQFAIEEERLFTTLAAEQEKFATANHIKIQGL